MYGWAGKILRVDLSTGNFTTTGTMDYADGYLGGIGINTKILYDEVPPEIGYFDPENRLIFSTGPLTGSLAPSSGRCSVTTKSPITGILGDANFGGQWGAELKFAGYDTLVIEGKAPNPVYLWIDDGNVEIRDAGDLWGRDTWKTQIMIKEDLGRQTIRTACIGNAGENLVRYAAIVTGTSDTAARTGVGAVMGSKLLKAIAIHGTSGIRVADPTGFKETSIQAHELLKISSEGAWFKQRPDVILRDMLEVVVYGNRENIILTDAEKNIFVKRMKHFTNAYSVKNTGCFGCPLQCQQVHELPGVGSLKISCEMWIECQYFAKVFDSKFNFQCLILLQKYGMDIFSTGASIAFIIDCFEKGIISKSDTGGLELCFGDRDLFLELIDKTAKREGIGDLIAEGIHESARKIGGDAEKYAFTTKKLELPNFSIKRIDNAFAAARAERGGLIRGNGSALELIAEDPEGNRPMVEELFKTGTLPDEYHKLIPKVAILNEQISCAADLTGICKWVTSYLLMPVDFEMLSNLVSAATGLDIDVDTLKTFTERQANACRAYNLREGISNEDDKKIQKYVKSVTQAHKGADDVSETLEKMFKEYYELKGWDSETGIPTKEKLEDLDLNDIADDLEKRGFIS